MSPERYAGSAGLARLREDEDRMSGRARTDAQAARRDLVGRLPYGRALDVEHLAELCDEGDQTNRAIVMRRLLLREIRKNLPTGILIDAGELALLRADSTENPTRPSPCPKVAEWPAAR